MTESQAIPEALFDGPKPERFEFNWINIIAFIIFIGVCAWMLAHDPCATCSITYPGGEKVTCADIIGAYVNYSNEYVPVEKYVRRNFSFNLDNLSES